MQLFLPGTTIEVSSYETGMVERVFNNIFAGGGLVLSQVSAMTGLEPYLIQNWVKRGFLTSPQRRMYSKRQFSRIVIINMLRESMQLDRITSLMSYINGHLDDESDDMIDDFSLYCIYVDLLSLIGNDLPTEKSLHASIDALLSSYSGNQTVDKVKLSRVLELMTYAHFSAYLRRKGDILFAEITEDK